MKSLVIAVSGAIAAMALGFSAQAQTLPAAQADPVRLSLARDILAASGGLEGFETQTRAMIDSMVALTESVRPDADPKIRETSRAMLRYMADEQIKALPILIDQAASIYAANLTEAELRDMLAWSVSPSGRAVRAKTPAIMQQMLMSQAPLLKKIMAGAMKTAVDRACDETKCTEDERRTITAMIEAKLPAS